jgi:DNA helicase HerA-like ATPase
MSTSPFDRAMTEGYSFEGAAIEIGAPLQEGKVASSARVRIPLSMMNRHGLISGATGTGKTKTLQLLAERLSDAGVAVFASDIKGDLSGLAAPGGANSRIEERCKALGMPYKPAGYPVEFYSLSGKTGLPLRATVSSFGPLLLSRVLDLNDTQQSVLALVFKLCDDRNLLLLDLADLREVLQWISGEGADALADYGSISKATVGVLLRKMVELEQQGAKDFFGEPELDVEDLLRTDASGRGVINILELNDFQDRPALFSTFLMWLLACLWRELPEVGDLDKPKLVFFFDEAHLLFEGASKALLQQVEQVARLIRSKGVGIFFVTHTPKDVPDDVLAQLGHRVQHALRAFTPDDDKKLRATANTFPKTEFYDIPKTITSLGIGEALVTALTPRGTPSPVAATLIAPPSSKMEPIPPAELNARVAASQLSAKYSKAIDRVSAREMLQKNAPAEARSDRGEPSVSETVTDVLNSPMARTLGRELVRGIFGVLGVSTRSRTRRRY